MKEEIEEFLDASKKDDDAMDVNALVWDKQQNKFVDPKRARDRHGGDWKGDKGKGKGKGKKGKGKGKGDKGKGTFKGKGKGKRKV
jgi:hypothetical protein